MPCERMVAGQSAMLDGLQSIDLNGRVGTIRRWGLIEYGPWDMALGGDSVLAKGYKSPMGDLSVGELGSSPIGGSREARRRAVKRETRKFFRRAENRSAGTEVVDGVRMRQGARGQVAGKIVQSNRVVGMLEGEAAEVMARVGMGSWAT